MSYVPAVVQVSALAKFQLELGAKMIKDLGHQARAACLGRPRTPPRTVGSSGSLAMVETKETGSE